MVEDIGRASGGPALLCFDGSDDAAHAITRAAGMLGSRHAVVLSVWEPVAVWQPYDPVTVVTAPLARLASNAMGLDEIARELAQERADMGVEVARRAGFEAESRIAGGKPWRVICDVAEEIGAEPIVVGGRGLSRVQSALLGSVSSATVQHARRPVLVVHHQPEPAEPTRSE